MVIIEPEGQLLWVVKIQAFGRLSIHNKPLSMFSYPPSALDKSIRLGQKMEGSSWPMAEVEASKIDDDIREAWYSFLGFFWGGCFYFYDGFFLLRDGS